jgi:hypothetical protein
MEVLIKAQAECGHGRGFDANRSESGLHKIEWRLE